MSCVLQWNKVRQRAIQWLGQGWTVLGRAVFLQCLYYYIAYFQPHTFLVSLTQLVGDENEPRVAVGKETLLRLRRLLGPTDQMQRTGQLYASSSLRFSIGTLRPFTFHWWRGILFLEWAQWAWKTDVSSMCSHRGPSSQHLFNAVFVLGPRRGVFHSFYHLVTCMPLVERQLSAWQEDPPGESRRHWFPCVFKAWTCVLWTQLFLPQIWVIHGLIGNRKIFVITVSSSHAWSVLNLHPSKDCSARIWLFLK